MVMNVPATLQGMDSVQKEAWADVQSRTMMAKQLLTGDASMLNQMVEMQYRDQRGQHPDLGNEVLRAARALP